MIDVYLSLKKPPFQAVIDWVNDSNGLAIDYQYVNLVDLLALGSTLTQIRIEAKPNPSFNPPVVGAKDLTYDRIDLENFLTPEDRVVSVVHPATTQVIIDHLITTYDLVVDSTDFVIENLPTDSSTYLLKAHPASLRWVGNVLITLSAG